METYPATNTQSRRHRSAHIRWNPIMGKGGSPQAKIRESLKWGYNGLSTITRFRKKQISIETLLKEHEDI